jgi:glycosyltransferase involved in cell wall biosynthesis
MAPRRLGLAWWPDDDEPPFSGARVARETFLQALLRHGTVDVELFARPGDVARVARYARLQGGPGPARRRPTVRTTALLHDSLGQGPLHAWHEPRGLIWPCLTIRRLRGGHYPITAMTHAVSAASYLRAMFLRMLLEDVRPADSLICASSSGRRAVEHLFAATAEEVHRRCGARLTYRGRLDVIPLGVDVERFRPRPRAPARHRLGLPAPATVLLWVGRLSASHKADLLPFLQVVQRVRAATRRDVWLLLAGPEWAPREGARLTRRAAELGLGGAFRWVPGLEDAALAYAASDVFVSPVDSPQEMFGLTPLEAMAAGLPAVVADWDGYRETVVDGVTGFLVPTAWAPCDDEAAVMAALDFGWEDDHLALAQSVSIDLDALEQRLSLLVLDRALRRRLGRQAREHVVARFAWPLVIRRYEDLWAELGRIARTPGARRPVQGWVGRPVFHRAFGHFASRTLEDESPVAATEAGLRVAAGAEPLPWRRVPLDTTVLMGMLERLSAAAPGAVPLGRLVGRGAARRGWRVRHALWLLKQGLARAPRRSVP